MITSNTIDQSSASGENRVIYCDGGCYNAGVNKGIGSWAFVEYKPDSNIAYVYAGFVNNTTNNRTEMLAVINAIQSYSEHSNIHIISDSGYVVKGYNDPSYLDAWIRSGWKTSKGTDVQNVDLWSEIIKLTYHYGVKFSLIRGHYKDPNPIHAYWNAVVDRACTMIMAEQFRNPNVIYTIMYNTKTKSFEIPHIHEIIGGNL